MHTHNFGITNRLNCPSRPLKQIESKLLASVMEALWNLEDKWKLTTQQALILFTCAAFAVIGLCTATMLKRKSKRKELLNNQDPACSDGGSSTRSWSQPPLSKWVKIRRMLMGSVRWSEANKWREEAVSVVGSRREPPPPPIIVGFQDCESSSSMGWQRQSHNSVSPVWQRPILMGEKCKLPRFSGLILYDERGRLLDHSLTSSNKENIDQEKPAVVLRTTLKDLL